MQNLRPCSRPTQLARATQQYVQCQVEKLSPGESLPSKLLGNFSALGSLHLCKPRLPRHLILFPQGTAYKNALPKKLYSHFKQSHVRFLR